MWPEHRYIEKPPVCAAVPSCRRAPLVQGTALFLSSWKAQGLCHSASPHSVLPALPTVAGMNSGFLSSVSHQWPSEDARECLTGSLGFGLGVVCPGSSSGQEATCTVLLYKLDTHTHTGSILLRSPDSEDREE